MAISDLETIMANRRWNKFVYPFQHVTATQVFTTQAYAHLEASFQAHLDGGLSEAPVRNKFSRIFRDYDAYGASIPQDDANPLALFLTKEWHDLLASIFGLDVTGDMSGEMHHHLVDSRNGSAHNDFSPGWFLSNSENEIPNISNSDMCHYKTGKTTRDGLVPVERMRALTCIIYLANEKWHEGDGGETGLYATRDTPVDKPDVSVPPQNNSLLAFPVTPYSFHSFLTNKRTSRNSIVLWLHRKYDSAVEEWGSKAVAHWK